MSLGKKFSSTQSLLRVGAPRRVHIRAYRDLNKELAAQADEINWRHATDSWRPILFINEHYETERVHALYRIATACVVSSLHDGMNLVAKEFVAARDDLRGVLVLSHFAGAARELTEALVVNPYDVDSASTALAVALSMPPDQQAHRMRAMRALVSEFNVYR